MRNQCENLLAKDTAVYEKKTKNNYYYILKL